MRFKLKALVQSAFLLFYFLKNNLILHVMHHICVNCLYALLIYDMIFL